MTITAKNKVTRVRSKARIDRLRNESEEPKSVVILPMFLQKSIIITLTMMEYNILVVFDVSEIISEKVCFQP